MKGAIMKIVLDKQTTEVHISKNATNVDFNRCFWNATFITDFKTDGNISLQGLYVRF